MILSAAARSPPRANVDFIPVAIPPASSGGFFAASHQELEPAQLLVFQASTAHAKVEVADVFRQYEHRLGPLHRDQRRVVNDIVRCRTAALGGHVTRCDGCADRDQSYNSCRNRHCPKCGYSKTRDWLEARIKELLPVPYFHVVFTIPAELNTLFIRNRRVMLNLLYGAAWQTIKAVSRRRHQGTPGAIASNHTWGSNLSWHPHIHMIVAGGVLQDSGVFKVGSEKYLLPKAVLRQVFRAKFIAGLRKLYNQSKLDLSGRNAMLDMPMAFHDLLDKVARKKWIVEARAPFSTPFRVLKYLANYTHRMAISNNRIIKIEAGRVYFKYKKYRGKRGGKPERGVTSLTAEEFMTRFLTHVSPRRFVRTRFYGFLANSEKGEAISMIREQLAGTAAAGNDAKNFVEPLLAELEKTMPRASDLCRVCKTGRRHVVEEIAPVATARVSFYSGIDTS